MRRRPQRRGVGSARVQTAAGLRPPGLAAAVNAEVQSAMRAAAARSPASRGVEFFVEDGEGKSVTDVAKGAACRSWLAGRCACSNAQAADEQALVTPRPASGRHEKRAEHQKIGAGGKAKAKQLKQQRAKARAQAAAAADVAREDDSSQRPHERRRHALTICVATEGATIYHDDARIACIPCVAAHPEAKHKAQQRAGKRLTSVFVSLTSPRR